ncbi:MAG: PPC domain-containing protein [Candidatus Eisenbacteria bacterium]
MKKIFAIAICLAFAAPVLADPVTGIEEKPWSYSPYDIRADVNETEDNGTFATADPIECGDVFHAAISPGGDNDYIVFSITTAGTVITFGTDADGATPIGDTKIYLYNSAQTQVGYDDDSGPGYYSLITYTAPAAGTYYGRIIGYTASYTGTYKAFVNCQAPQPPPPNDQCSGAIEILCNTAVNLAGSTQWAFNDYDPGPYPNTCTRFPEAGKDVTYKFTVPAGSVVSLNYTSSADGAIYIVTDCADVIGTCVIGEDSTVTGGLEDIENFPLPGAGTYYVILDSYGTNTWGTWTLTGMVTCPTATEETSWGRVKTLYR